MPIDDTQQVPLSDDAAPEPEARADAVTPEDAEREPPEPVVPDREAAPPGPESEPADDATAADAAPVETRTVEDVMESGPDEPAVSDHLVAVVEALVFASPEPITPKQLFKLLNDEPKESVEAAIEEFEARYEARGGGLQIVQVAGGYQIVTRPELAGSVRRMFHERTSQKLSLQALETLAVIAYKQPITAAEIAEIRAVNTSGVIGTLLERGLVKISGRKQVVGRPFLYSTTREFLDRFGLRDLSDLPKVEDMAGALGFEPPAGLAVEVVDTLPLSDEPATEEDVAVLTGEGDEDVVAADPDADTGDDGER